MTATPDPERSARQAAGARRRWAKATPAERKAATAKATAVVTRRHKAAHELLAHAEAALLAAGAEVRWPGSAR